jgi:orotidine-5'-phosphate decarboxylase
MAEIVLALDTGREKALDLIKRTSGIIKYYKMGQALFAEAPETADVINGAGGRVILDLKYHDIPSVIALAVEKVARKYSPFAITLHVSGGRKMMAAAAGARGSFPAGKKPILFGVTVLTSLDAADLASIGISAGSGFDMTSHVARLAKFAKDSGLDGAVCSGMEVAAVKDACGAGFLTLVPGLSSALVPLPDVQSGAVARTPKDQSQKSRPDPNYDQKRTVTIKDAAKAGGDFLVVGRMITEADDPRRAAEAAVKEAAVGDAE